MEALGIIIKKLDYKMFNLLKYREQLNLTQEELAVKSGLSVRTIQRIEAGNSPKGYTLRVLANALGIDPEEIVTEAKKDIKAKGLEIDQDGYSKETSEHSSYDIQLIKLINFSSLPFIFLPPLNIIAPLLITFYKKEKNLATRQILSIQILWTILAVVIFMLGVFIRKWFNLDNRINTVIIVGLIIVNALIILKNAAGIDRRGRLSFRLNFSLL